MNNLKQNLIEYTSQSRRGNRSENQDCAEQYIDDAQAVFIVADGLGGHKNGRFAARYFCERFIQQTIRHHTVLHKDPARILQELFTLAEHDLLKALKSYPDGLEARTTCVIAYCSEEVTLSLHMGDSRFYFLDQKRIIWQSKDHSAVQLMVDRKQISKQEALTHPERNRIYKCLGGPTRLTPDLQELPALKQAEVIVVCSDGFWHCMSQQRLGTLVNASDFDLQLQLLTQQAIRDANGKSDNVTAIAVRKSR